MFRRAVDVGAEIEDVVVAFDGGDGGTDGRPIDARQRLQHKTGGRHQRTGVAGAHAGVRLTGLHQIDRHAHGGVFLVAHRRGRQFVHAHHLGGVVDAQTLARFAAVTPQLGFDGRLIANQDDVQLIIVLQRLDCCRYDYVWAVVAPHRIEGNSCLGSGHERLNGQW